MSDLINEVGKDLFTFQNKQYTREEFMEDQELTEDNVDGVIEILKNQGHIVFIYEKEKLSMNKLIEKAKKQAQILQASVAIEEDEELEDIRIRERAREGRHVYEKVVFEFPNMEQAESFTNNTQNLRLQSEINIGARGDYEVSVFNLTDKELSNLSLVYKANQTIRATVRGVDKAVNGAVKATDYTAKRIISPIAKIGLSGALGIGKCLISTGAKLGGTTVTETIRATKSTCETIAKDESIKVARAEICKVGNDIKGQINKNRGVSSNGIRIE